MRRMIAVALLVITVLLASAAVLQLAYEITPRWPVEGWLLTEDTQVLNLYWSGSWIYLLLAVELIAAIACAWGALRLLRRPHRP